MVRKEKFSEDVEYDAVFLQPARLASHLLVTPQAVHYFLAIIRSAPRRSVVGFPESMEKHTYHELRHIDDLQDSDYIEVARYLEQVTKALIWVIKDMSNYAEMKPTRRDSTLSPRCRITIGKRLYEALLQTADSDRKLRRQLLLAITMVHELAHAAMYALTEMWTESTFGPNGAEDAGFELEARLFGLCPYERTMLSGNLCWYELVTLKDQSPNINPPVERVQIDFIHELFTDWFWQHRLSAGDAWEIIPSAARSSVVYIPSSIRALIRRSAGVSIPSIPTAETEAEASSSKRESSDDDDDDNTRSDCG